MDEPKASNLWVEIIHVYHLSSWVHVAKFFSLLGLLLSDSSSGKAAKLTNHAESV